LKIADLTRSGHNQRSEARTQPPTICYTDAQCRHHESSNTVVMKQRTRTACAFQQINASTHLQRCFRQKTKQIVNRSCDLTRFIKQTKRNKTFLAMTVTQSHYYNRVNQQPTQIWGGGELRQWWWRDLEGRSHHHRFKVTLQKSWLNWRWRSGVVVGRRSSYNKWSICKINLSQKRWPISFFKSLLITPSS